jgi:hypothetical protein
LSDNYQSVLIMLGLSMDFYDDILKDFNGYQKRFGADVTRMNDFVRAQGLPPIVGLTFNQFVEVGGRGHRIAQIAEKLMRDAGFDVIPTDDYYRRYDGRAFTVSRWEGHPDEEANMLFASMFYDHLGQRRDVQRFALKRDADVRALQAVDARVIQ